ncbi:hypothetical protein DsansV1_C01g0001461 [Dioscorea sansibarensis]
MRIPQQLLCSLRSLGQEKITKSCYWTDATHLSSPLPVKKSSVLAISSETHAGRYTQVSSPCFLIFYVVEPQPSRYIARKALFPVCLYNSKQNV